MSGGVAGSRARVATVPFRLTDHPHVVRAASVLATLCAWEWYGRGVDPIFLSYPSAILRVVPEMLRRGELQDAVLSSGLELIVGLALAIGGGTLLGMLMGRYRLLDNLLEMQVSALYSTPNVALIPLFILWFGLGFSSKIAIIFLAGFFPVVINTYSGVRNVGQGLVDVAFVEGANETKIFTKIILPASLPFVMTGIRLAMGRAIVGMVVAEMFTATDGLGGAIIAYGNSFATNKLFVVIIILALFGVILTEIVKALEHAMAPWKASERAK